MARACYLRKAKESYLNKDNSKYCTLDSFSDSDSSSEKNFKRRDNRRRFKVAESQKDVKYLDGGKRRKLSLEEAVNEFKEVFDTSFAEIKYCKLEKCRIETEPGKKIIKKGQIVPQALIKRTVLHLEDLERRKVIRKSTSE